MNICSICREEFNNNTKQVLECKHVYHEYCINKINHRCVKCEKKRWQWVNNFGCSLIKTVDIDVGGSEIDNHYSNYLKLWRELAGSK